MLPPPPAPDAILFRPSRARTAGYVVLSSLFAGLCVAVVQAGLSVAAGRSFLDGLAFATGPQVLGAAAVGTAVGTVAGGVFPAWVRVSAAGLEIGQRRARAILVPWADVESATLRGWWLFGTLDVVPGPECRIAVQEARGRLPVMRTRGGRRGYPVWPWFFPGGPAAFLTALRERGVRAGAAP